MIKVKPALYLRHTFSYIVVVAALIWTLFPIWWAFVFSFKRPQDFFTAKIVPFVQNKRARIILIKI